MSAICFYNGQFLEKNHLYLSIDDLGFSRGYALFEHIRTYHKKPFHLKEHLVRLFQAAQEVHIDIEYSFDEIKQILDFLIQKNPFEEFGFKIYLTLGIASSGLIPESKPTFIVLPYPLRRYQRQDFSDGIEVATTFYQRAFPYLKTTFYLPGILAKKKHKRCDQILFLDEQKNFLESTIASFCAFKKNTLILPKGALLKSVTQEVIFELAKSNFEIERREIHLSELEELDEVFLSSSTKEVLPIKKIDQMEFNPTSFKNTKTLQLLFEEYIFASEEITLTSFQEKEEAMIL
jgi:branched-subunit amino acid aminotransferase/4-amino-4-deoxychorismate lyase